MDDYNQLVKKLKENGCSATNSRRALFRVLYSSLEPLSIQQMISLLAEFDEATIYRNISLFEKISIIHPVWFGLKSRYELSDAFRPHHHHLVCLRCGLTRELRSHNLESSLKDMAKNEGFTLHHHHVELSGVCNNCEPKSS